MKKGLTRTKILDYLDANNIETVDQVFEKRQEIFDLIKGDPELEVGDLTMEQFDEMMLTGKHMAIARERQKAFLRAQGVNI